MDPAHLLIVEDNEDLADLVATFFRDDGFTVHVASTGAEAIALSTETKIDLALLDIRLPDIDGYEVFQKLRQNPRTQHIPVILLTERRDRGNRLHGLEMGVVDYVTKPFDTEELRLRVRNALNRSLLRKNANPLTELPLAPDTDRRLRDLVVGKSSWSVLQLSLSPLDKFRTEYGFIAGADLLRAVALTLRSVLRDLELTDAFAGHLTTEDVAIALGSEKAAAAVDELKSRLGDMLPRFLPPKAREQNERPVKLQIARIDHDNAAVTDLDSLKVALTAALAPIVY